MSNLRKTVSMNTPGVAPEVLSSMWCPAQSPCLHSLAHPAEVLNAPRAVWCDLHLVCFTDRDKKKEEKEKKRSKTPPKSYSTTRRSRSTSRYCHPSASLGLFVCSDGKAVPGCGGVMLGARTNPCPEDILVFSPLLSFSGGTVWAQNSFCSLPVEERRRP